MKRFNATLLNISGILMIAITILATFQVFTRRVLEMPFPWVEELIRYTSIAMVFIAVGIAVFRREHINVDILDITINCEKKLRVIDALRQILIIGFSVIFAYHSYQYIMKQISVGQVSPAMQISMGWPLAFLLIGSIIVIINGVYLVLTVKKYPNYKEEAD